MNDIRWFNTETSNAILQGSRMNWGFAEFVRLELLHTRYKSKKCGPTPPIIVHLPEFDPDFTTRGWLQGADAAKKATTTRNSTPTSKFVDKRWGNLSTKNASPSDKRRRRRGRGGAAAAARKSTGTRVSAVPQPPATTRPPQQCPPATAAASAITRYAPQPRNAAY